MRHYLLISLFILSACGSRPENTETFPEFERPNDVWVTGTAAETIEYQEDREDGETITGHYLKASYQGDGWNTIISPSYRPTTIPGTVSYIVVIGMEPGCERMDIQVRMVGSASVLHEQSIELIDSEGWHEFTSGSIEVNNVNNHTLALQFDFKGVDCQDGALLVDYAEIGEDLNELRLSSLGSRPIVR